LFDPRTDLIGLFTNSRLGAASRYSNTSVYIRLVKETVDNKDTEPNDYGTKYVGILWLKPPRTYNTSADVGFNTTEHDVIIDCHLIIPRNDQWLKNTHETFANNITHSFETTIRTNASASGKSWQNAEVSNMPISNDPDNPNVCYRVLEVTCFKAD
jgi:hypothetical protein